MNWSVLLIVIIVLIVLAVVLLWTPQKSSVRVVRPARKTSHTLAVVISEASLSVVQSQVYCRTQDCSIVTVADNIWFVVEEQSPILAPPPISVDFNDDVDDVNIASGTTVNVRDGPENQVHDNMSNNVDPQDLPQGVVMAVILDRGSAIVTMRRESVNHDIIEVSEDIATLDITVVTSSRVREVSVSNNTAIEID